MKGVKRMKISKVSWCKEHLLIITWDDGTELAVDLQNDIMESPSLQNLLKVKTFKTVHVDEYGWALNWDGDISLGSDTLLCRALEQAGELTSWETFDKWRKEMSLSLSETARTLGISRRMVAYYSNREQAIPKMVGLAIEGLRSRVAG